MFCSIWQKSEIAGSLYSCAEQPLMLGTDASPMPRLHLATVGDEATQRISLFVIYLPRSINTEWTDPTFRN